MILDNFFVAVLFFIKIIYFDPLVNERVVIARGGTMIWPWLKKAFKKDKLLLLFIGFTVAIGVIFLQIKSPWFLKLMDYRLYDVALKSKPAVKRSGKVAIIDIDEKSIAEIGQFPWARHRLAVLLDTLKQAGALSVGLDIVFAEKDRTSPNSIVAELKKNFPKAAQNLNISGLPPILNDNDQLFAQVLATGPFVLGYTFLYQNDSGFSEDIYPDEDPLGRINIAVKTTVAGHSADPTRHMYNADSAVYPLRNLMDAAPATGFFTTGTDEDGTIRRVPLLTSKHGKIYPSLALATLLEALRFHQNKKITPILKIQNFGAESLRIGPYTIPVDLICRVMVNFYGGRGEFPYISASDIINKDPEALKQVAGKFLFVGTSAKGLEDIRTTPFTQFYPGVETHATILDNILTKQFLQTPHWGKALEILAVFICGLLATILLTWAPARFVLIPFLGMGFGLWFGSMHIFSSEGYWVSPLYPLMNLALTFTTLTLIKFWREERQKQFIHGAFAQYLAPTVIEQIMDNPDALSLDGEEKEITILFSDVRSFTSLSEKLSPTQVTDLLHDYLTPMTRIITQKSGTLDKFIGDATMAFWNAPLDVPNHEILAVDSAIEQLAKLDELNVLFQEKFGFPIAIGIGVHSGLVRVGNMGSADLFDYTLIGDNVNLASRLEGLTKFYGQQIIVSQVIQKACGDKYVFPEMDSVRVKGKKEPITIFTVRTHEQAAEHKVELDRYAEALALYKSMRFQDAILAFHALEKDFANKVLYSMYAERCEHLRDAPPEGDWDGVFTHTTK